MKGLHAAIMALAVLNCLRDQPVKLPVLLSAAFSLLVTLSPDQWLAAIFVTLIALAGTPWQEWRSPPR